MRWESKGLRAGCPIPKLWCQLVPLTFCLNSMRLHATHAHGQKLGLGVVRFKRIRKVRATSMEIFWNNENASRLFSQYHPALKFIIWINFADFWLFNWQRRDHQRDGITEDPLWTGTALHAFKIWHFYYFVENGVQAAQSRIRIIPTQIVNLSTNAHWKYDCKLDCYWLIG